MQLYFEFNSVLECYFLNSTHIFKGSNKKETLKSAHAYHHLLLRLILYFILHMGYFYMQGSIRTTLIIQKIIADI